MRKHILLERNFQVLIHVPKPAKNKINVFIPSDTTNDNHFELRLYITYKTSTIGLIYTPENTLVSSYE